VPRVALKVSPCSGVPVINGTPMFAGLVAVGGFVGGGVVFVVVVGRLVTVAVVAAGVLGGVVVGLVGVGGVGVVWMVVVGVVGRGWRPWFLAWVVEKEWV